MPSIRAVAALEAKGDVERGAACDRFRPGVHRPLEILGVDDVTPAAAEYCVDRAAGVDDPALVDVIDAAARIGRPDELRHAVGKEPVMPARFLGTRALLVERGHEAAVVDRDRRLRRKRRDHRFVARRERVGSRMPEVKKAEHVARSQAHGCA